MIYFYDDNGKYIGCRELLDGESVPSKATTVELVVLDGQEAYFVNGAWEVNTINVAPVAVTIEPTTEEVLDELITLLVDKGVIY